MEIELIRIANFKSLKSVEFEPKRLSCLVGENNSGKSALLQAIAYALKRPTSLDKREFYDQKKAVEFTVCLSNINETDLRRLEESHRGKIAPLVENGKFRYIVRYYNKDREIKLLRKQPNEERLRESGFEENFKGVKGQKQIKAVIESKYLEWANDFPATVATIGDAKEYLSAEISKLDASKFGLYEAELPTGISASINDFVPEPVYIQAVKDLADDMKTAPGADFGKLIGLLLEDLAPQLIDIQDALEKLRSMLNRPEGDTDKDARLREVIDLETLVQKFLREQFPNIGIDIRVPPPELRTIFGTAEIYIDDGSKDLVANKGDGVKRSVTFSILRAYVEKLEDNRRKELEETGEMKNSGASKASSVAPRRLIFLYEEPELYLHPKSQRILFQALEQISKLHQVVLTTHSPLFFAPGITGQFVRLDKKPAEPKPVSNLNKIDFDLDPQRADVFKLTRFENADAAFFASAILLFEGESDDYFISHVASCLNCDWDFNKHNIALVRVGGKGNFTKYREYFQIFGIKVMVLSDLDALFNQYEHLGAPKSLDGIRSEVIQKIDQHIDREGVSPDITVRRLKRKMDSADVVKKYETAKAAVKESVATGKIDPKLEEKLDALFAWERDDIRVKAVKSLPHAAQEIVPLLDELRNIGIFVLSRGEIEDYYPSSVAQTGPKPQRALEACKTVNTKSDAEKLSDPLAIGRPTELREIFDMLFKIATG